MIINYFDGNNEIEIEVSESVGEQYLVVDNESRRNNWKHERRAKRHGASFEAMDDNGFQFVDESVDIENDYIKTEDNKTLHNAIKQLLPQQQELIRKVYFDGESIAQIARAECVCESAIRNRLNKIYKKIREFLN